VHKKKKEKKQKDIAVPADVEEKELTKKVLEQLDAVSKETTANGDVRDSKMTVKEVDARPVGALVPFANPLADDKVAKKVLKSVKKAAVNKSLKRGVKEVVKALRKSPFPSHSTAATSPVGVVVLAADISPMDVISHIPVLCEDHGIPYVYVTSRAELGSASATKRPTSVVMVLPRSAGKNKKKEDEKKGDEKKEDGEAGDFSKVYEEFVKIVQEEGKRVRV